MPCHVASLLGVVRNPLWLPPGSPPRPSLPGPPVEYTGGDLWDADGRGSSSTERILVCVRKRPMLRAELATHDFDVVSVDAHHGGLVVHEPKARVDLVKSVEHHRCRGRSARRLERSGSCTA